eukprot:m.101345 g.101345  ORF g.101345 m.101345 type:complete len:637 (-) comp15658_c0_seq1:477-2387(-)
MFEVKYRGVAAVNNFRPTQSLPRPGAAEAAQCLKQISQREKVSQLVVLSVSTEEGVRCFDTTVNPPRMVFACSVYEIAHCGQHPANPVYFSLIIGSRERPDLFLCHAFKCPSKDASMKITRAVASACTAAYQSIRERRASQGAGSGGGSSASLNIRGGSVRMSGSSGQVMRSPSQQQVQAPMPGSGRRQAPTGTAPKLTDSWFRPTASRDEVPQLFRNAEIGDFIVRQSQSQPGDYAISVYTGGPQLWTGLIISTERGYQLGQKGGRQFPDLTDLIAFYMITPFMKDVNDRPLTLRLTEQQPVASAAGAAGSQGDQSPDSDGRFVRKSTFRNPPLDFMTTKAARAAEAVSAEPACGWPQSSDDEEDYDGEEEAFTHKKKTSSSGGRKASEEEEREMFEKFMNAQIGKNGEAIQFDAEDIDEEEDEEDDDDDEALEALRVASMSQNSPPKTVTAGGPPPLSSNKSSNASIGFDDEFIPPAKTPPLSKEGSRHTLPLVTAAMVQQAQPPKQTSPPKQTTPPPQQRLQQGPPQEDVPPLLPLTQYIFESLPRDAEDCISGVDVRPVLMRSGLSTAMLGQIWMEVDLGRKGKIDFEQLGLILGLISQAQEGGSIQLEKLDPDTIAAPRMEGLTPDKYSMY